MKTIQLNTNIMCGSYKAKVTPTFNEEIGEANWKVDTQNLKKIFTVTTDKHDESEVIKAVEKAGYKAEKVA